MKIKLTIFIVSALLFHSCETKEKRGRVISEHEMVSEAPVDSLYIRHLALEKTKERMDSIQYGKDSIAKVVQKRYRVRQLKESEQIAAYLKTLPSVSYHPYAIDDKHESIKVLVDSVTNYRIEYGIFNDFTRKMSESRPGYKGQISSEWPEPGTAILIINENQDTIINRKFYMEYFEKQWNNSPSGWDINDLKFIGFDQSNKSFKFRFQFGIFDSCGELYEELSIDTSGMCSIQKNE